MVEGSLRPHVKAHVPGPRSEKRLEKSTTTLTSLKEHMRLVIGRWAY